MAVPPADHELARLPQRQSRGDRAPGLGGEGQAHGPASGIVGVNLRRDLEPQSPLVAIATEPTDEDASRLDVDRTLFQKEDLLEHPPGHDDRQLLKGFADHGASGEARLELPLDQGNGLGQLLDREISFVDSSFRSRLDPGKGAATIDPGVLGPEEAAALKRRGLLPGKAGKEQDRDLALARRTATGRKRDPEGLDSGRTTLAVPERIDGEEPAPPQHELPAVAGLLEVQPFPDGVEGPSGHGRPGEGLPPPEHLQDEAVRRVDHRAPPPASTSGCRTTRSPSSRASPTRSPGSR